MSGASRDKAAEIDLDAVRAAAKELMRQFDSVQIFATRHEGASGTVNVQYGAGNWFARYGQVKRWFDIESGAPEDQDSLQEPET